MKKTIIGSVILLAGVLITVGIIICGTLYLPHINGWSTTYHTKLFYTIMAGKPKFYEGSDCGLGLGLLFVIGIIMGLIGLVILIKEYIKE